jgi:hypothetical protein
MDLSIIKDALQLSIVVIVVVWFAVVFMSSRW